jgi:MFS family permease
MIGFFGWQSRSQTRPDDAQRAAESVGAQSPLRDPYCLAFLGLVLCTSTVFFQFHTTYPLFLRDHYGLAKPVIGLIYAVNTGVIVVFEMLLLDFVSGWPPIRVIGWGAMLSCLGFGMLPWGRSVAFCVASMLVITLGEMLWMPLASGWIAQRSRRGNRGMYMGWYMMTYSLAGVSAPAVGGAIYQYDRQLLWHMSIGLGIVVLVGFSWLHMALTNTAVLDHCSQNAA